ncbi:MAG: AAA-like domain-containing protein [Crocosphaera sp.]|nr:AAA-like domain-containing protein [Crocosphaera sp.]
MNDFYHIGGSVPLNSPSYIKREADDTLYSTLRNGQLCYVLNSRQMGKSSLWVHTQNRLKKKYLNKVQEF